MIVGSHRRPVPKLIQRARPPMALPTSLEAYYQEAGRAGRDGLPARCTILYASADRSTLTVRAKRDALTIETLRAIYGAIKSRLDGGSVGRVAMGDLQRDVQAEETTVRVALSMLEEAGLLKRHQDAPRTAVISLPMDRYGGDQSDPDLAAFVGAARLRRGDRLPIDPIQVARRAGLNPLNIEERLLAWSDAGYLSYHPIGRELLLEMLPPPQDAAARIEAQLERYATIQLQRIDEIVAYAKTSRCRHGHISAYLSGHASSTCRSCDNCAPRRPTGADASVPDLPDEREQIMAILRCVATAPWNWGRMNLVRILRGDQATPEQGRGSCAWGALAFRSTSAISTLLNRLIKAGFLQPRQLSNGGTVFDITDAGRSALADPTKLASLMPHTPTKRGPQIGTSEETQEIPVDEALFEALRAWRRSAAAQAGLPAYYIAHDALLQRIAALRPTTETQLGAIKGMGKRKMAQYGAAILEIVKQAQS